MAGWIFQGNPDYIPMENILLEDGDIEWSVELPWPIGLKVSAELLGTRCYVA